MIDADHWHDCGDGTAWLVTSQTVNGKPYLPLFPNGHGYTFESLDRPRDGCDGEGFASNEMVMGVDCPECNGTGCHTFVVEVECLVRCSPADHLFQGGATCSVCNGLATLTYRVSVEPGMILPIRDWHWKPSDGTPQRWLSENGVTFEQTNLHRYSLRESDGFHITSHPSNIALPPAASPGQYAVKLRIHE